MEELEPFFTYVLIEERGYYSERRLLGAFDTLHDAQVYQAICIYEFENQAEIYRPLEKKPYHTSFYIERVSRGCITHPGERMGITGLDIERIMADNRYVKARERIDRQMYILKTSTSSSL